MTKSASLAKLLERRIRYGDYRLKEIPAERELAAQEGVSRKTARKAMLDLVDRGLLVRAENGRLGLREPSSVARGQFAVLKPATGERPLMLQVLMRLGHELDVRIRPVEFVHWDDPSIDEAIRSFEGVFLLPPAEPFPDRVLDAMTSADVPIVVINRDLSPKGLRSIDTCPPSSVSTLLDHLRAKGHTRIDCFNTQPHDETLRMRMAAWALWRTTHGMDGEMFDEPVQSYGNAADQAYCVFGRLLDKGAVEGTAVLCTTAPAAIAAMRCCHERGIAVGRDLSIASVDDEGMNRLLVPSLTSLSPPDPAPYLKLCIEWMCAGGQPADWHWPLLLKPEEMELFEGESVDSPVSAHV
ncbi:MAG: substrate-binding domain-containing protein [Planctomycetota bacterium]